MATLHLINVTTDPDLPHVNPHTYTLAINADSQTNMHITRLSEWSVCVGQGD